jgi:hypothetical protein
MGLLPQVNSSQKYMQGERGPQVIFPPSYPIIKAVSPLLLTSNHPLLQYLPCKGCPLILMLHPVMEFPDCVSFQQYGAWVRETLSWWRQCERGKFWGGLSLDLSDWLLYSVLP